MTKPLTQDACRLLDTLMRCAEPVYPRQGAASQLAELENDGCAFIGHPATGIRLASVGLACYGDYLNWATGCRVAVYQSTRSTQDLCRRMSHDPAGPWPGGGSPVLVVADQQTAGRGRLGRRWQSVPGGSALLSLSIRLDTINAERLSLAAGVAVAQTLQAALAGTGYRPALKWPNDALVHNNKIAGILIETDPGPGPVGPGGTGDSGGPRDSGGRIAIVGIGINITAQAAALDGRATSLHRLGATAQRLQIIADVVRALHRQQHQPAAALLDAWRSYCVLPDTPQSFTCNGSTVRGHVVDLDPDQGLIVRTMQGALIHLPAATTTTRG